MRVVEAVLASLAVVVPMGFFVPVLAAPGSSDNPPDVDPNVIQKSNDPEVPGSAEDNSVLPFTGGDILLFVVIGIAAIGAGTLTLRAVRYRRG